MKNYNYLVKEGNEIKGKYRVIEKGTGFEIARVSDIEEAFRLREQNVNCDIIDCTYNVKLEF